jgi:hypothetical protein
MVEYKNKLKSKYKILRLLGTSEKSIECIGYIIKNGCLKVHGNQQFLYRRRRKVAKC